MPQVYLEYTTGAGEGVDFKDALLRLHQVLAKVTGLRLDLIKTRLIRYDHYFVGNCEDEQEFVHLNISTVNGKAGDNQKRQDISSTVLATLAEIFEQDLAKKKVDISVQITEVPASGYMRRRSVSLKP